MNPHPSSGAVVARIPEVAARLGVSIRTVRRLIAAGQLRSVRLGFRVIGVPHAELDRFLSAGKA